MAIYRMPRLIRRPATSMLRAPLDGALSAPACVAILRALATLPEPVSHRELARRAGVQVRSAQQGLDVLIALGMATRAQHGRDNPVQLNRKHHLALAIIALFDSEAELFRRLREELVAAGAGRLAATHSVVGCVAASSGLMIRR